MRQHCAVYLNCLQYKQARYLETTIPVFKFYIVICWPKHLNLDIIKRIISILRSLTFCSCRFSSLGHAQRNRGSQLCDICLFKRRIIARDDLEHALYIIPVDKFHEVGNSSRLSVLTH